MKISHGPHDSMFRAALLAAAPLTLLALMTAPSAGASAFAPCYDAAGSDSSDKPTTHPRPGTPVLPTRPVESPLTNAPSGPGSSSSGPVHKKCPYSTQDCLNTMAQRLKSAGWIGIEYDADQPGYPKVQKVVPGSPAEKAGLEPGDELISLNGVDIKETNKEGNEEKMKAARGDWTPGHTAHYVVKRKGALKPIDITLGTWPADLLARYIGEHMLEHAEADAQAQAKAPSPKTP